MDIIIVGGAVFAILYAPQLGWDNPSMSTIFMIDSNEFYVGPSIRGSGNVVSQTREVSDFTAIEMDYPAQVTVTQGKSVSVKIEAEDNVLPGLQTRIRNGQTPASYYKVEDGKHVSPTKAVKITIVVKDLKEVEFDSAGDLTLTASNTDNLEISLSGAGNLKVNRPRREEFLHRSKRCWQYVCQW